MVEIPRDEANFYVHGFASGASSREEGMKSAAAHAVTQLIERFGIEAQSRYREWRTGLELKVQDELESVSEKVRLRGHLIVDWHSTTRVINGQETFDVHVLMRYPKAEWEQERARLYQKDTERHFRIRQAIRQAETSAKKGDVLPALSFYSEAIHAASGADEMLAHQAFHGMRTLAEGLGIRIETGKNQVAFFPHGPDYPFVVEVFFRNGLADIPAQGVPVLFRFVENGDTSSHRVRTDAKGYAQWRISFLNHLATEYVVVAGLGGVARTVFNALPKKYNPWKKRISDLLESRTVTFSFQAKTVPKGKTILVSIQELNHGTPIKPPMVGPRIIKRLREVGYQVLVRETLDGPDILVTGTALTLPGSTNLGIIRSSRAEGNVQVIDRKTREILAYIRLDAVGFGENDTAAGWHALKVLSKALARAIILKLVD